MTTYKSPNHKVSQPGYHRRRPSGSQGLGFSALILGLIMLFVMTVPVQDHIDSVIEMNELGRCW